MGHFPQNEVNYTKQPLSNFQPHFGKCPKQPQAEMKNGVAYKKKCVPFKFDNTRKWLFPLLVAPAYTIFSCDMQLCNSYFPSV